MSNRALNVAHLESDVRTLGEAFVGHYTTRSLGHLVRTFHAHRLYLLLMPRFSFVIFTSPFENHAFWAGTSCPE